MGGNVAENLSNQSVPEAAARVAAVVNRLVNRIGSNAESRERLAEIEIPEELRDNLALFLRLERRVLSEYDPEIADLFDKILTAEIVANAGNPGSRAADESVDEQGVPTADEPTAVAFREVVDLIDSLPLDKQQVIVRAFTSFFHLANLSEENYRVAQLREREAGASTDTEVDPANELTVAYHQLVNEMGVEGANELLGKLEFHPVFTAHPTEARRKAVEGKIRRISNLLEERPRLGGSDLVENERHMLQEID
ncbi:MAG: phosphoenolpyruvate carboxylase, partial [Collinsella sp.]